MHGGEIASFIAFMSIDTHIATGVMNKVYEPAAAPTCSYDGVSDELCCDWTLEVIACIHRESVSHDMYSNPT